MGVQPSYIEVLLPSCIERYHYPFIYRLLQEACHCNPGFEKILKASGVQRSPGDRAPWFFSRFDDIHGWFIPPVKQVSSARAPLVNLRREEVSTYKYTFGVYQFVVHFLASQKDAHRKVTLPRLWERAKRAVHSSGVSFGMTS